MDTFIIETAFLEYLKLMKLNIEELSQTQLIETKNAFYAGCGFMFRAFERAGELSSDESTMDVFASLEKQIETYFQNQVTDFQKKWN
jgi:hypothetical protein